MHKLQVEEFLSRQAVILPLAAGTDPQTRSSDPIRGVYDMFKTCSIIANSPLGCKTEGGREYSPLWSVLFSFSLAHFHPGSTNVSTPWFSINNQSVGWSVLLFYRWSFGRKVKYAFDISGWFQGQGWRKWYTGQRTRLLCSRQDDNFWTNGPIRLEDNWAEFKAKEICGPYS